MRGPRRLFCAQVVFGTAFTYLTSGVFLSGLAILMGAGDVLVSYLSVIANLCGVLILCLGGFFERFASRKRLTMGLTALTKLATLFIVAIPTLAPAEVQLWVFVPAVIVAFTLQAQTTVALNQWMVGFIDDGARGRYISFRQTLNLLVTVVLSQLGGYFLDRAEGKYIGFVALFLVAFVLGIIELGTLSRIPDAPLLPRRGAGRSLRDMVRIPLKNRPFLAFVLYISIFYLLLNISDSFTTVYLLRYLELSYPAVTSLYLLISLPQVVLLGVWGRVSDKKGHDFVLKVSVGLFAGETLFMALATPDSQHIFIPAAFLIASVANSGFAVAVFNRRYELMPTENRILYDNFFSAVIGVGVLLGPVTGGAIKGLLEASGGFRVLYLISTVGILGLQVAYSVRKRRGLAA